MNFFGKKQSIEMYENPKLFCCVGRRSLLCDWRKLQKIIPVKYKKLKVMVLSFPEQILSLIGSKDAGFTMFNFTE